MNSSATIAPGTEGYSRFGTFSTCFGLGHSAPGLRTDLTTRPVSPDERSALSRRDVAP